MNCTTLPQIKLQGSCKTVCSTECSNIRLNFSKLKSKHFSVATLSTTLFRKMNKSESSFENFLQSKVRVENYIKFCIFRKK